MGKVKENAHRAADLVDFDGLAKTDVNSADTVVLRV
jgi:hypothetical protein